MTSPVFPEFKPLGLEDRRIVQEFFDRDPYDACEFSFGNNFIWRHFDHPVWTILKGNLVFIFSPPGEEPYAMAPVGGREIPAAIGALLERAPRLSRVPSDFIAKYGSGFSCLPERDHFDYVYAARDLAELKGKKFDGKRNRIRKFEREHVWRYISLNRGHLEACRSLFEEWFSERDDDSDMAAGQKSAIQEALLHFEDLGLSGGAIEVDGRFAALSIGESLTRDMAVIHIEIVSPCCEGLAQIMNREFVRNTFRDFAFINREPDLGLPGLRRAKLSYQPARFVEKFQIRNGP